MINALLMLLRSAGAANKLEEAGFQNIACLSSGLQSVKPGYNRIPSLNFEIELKQCKYGSSGVISITLE